MLDSAGFAETNVPAVAQWPANMELLYRGDVKNPQIPSLIFLNNIKITNGPVGENRGLKRAFYVISSNEVVDVDEFRAIISETNNFRFHAGDDGVGIVVENTSMTVPAGSAGEVRFTSDPDARRVWNFLKIRACLYSMGITTQWMNNTNLPDGICEIFISPKP